MELLTHLNANMEKRIALSLGLFFCFNLSAGDWGSRWSFYLPWKHIIHWDSASHFFIQAREHLSASTLVNLSPSLAIRATLPAIAFIIANCSFIFSTPLWGSFTSKFWVYECHAVIGRHNLRFTEWITFPFQSYSVLNFIAFTIKEQCSIRRSFSAKPKPSLSPLNKPF